MRQNIVGTGPFEMEEWTALKGIFVKAAPGEHWRKTPYVERIRYLEIPEASTRLAMCETGEAQICEVDLKDKPGLLGTGKFELSPEGRKTVYMIMWSGLYWDRVHYITGEPLTYVEGGTRWNDISKPWIGDPYENFAGTPTEWREGYDESTPSMQNSRLVRHALSMAIDRDAINEVLLDGGGIPSYIAHMMADDPIINANLGKYIINYDPVTARQYLAQAGWSNGFTIPWWVGPSGLEVEISEAAGAQWLTDLNVTVEYDRQTYSSHRPRMVDRTLRYPQTRKCCHSLSTEPFEWTYGSPVPTGYNNGLETPEQTEIYYEKLKTIDPSAAEALAIRSADHLTYWRLNTGIVQVAEGPVYNKEKVVMEQVRPCLLSDRVGQIRQPEYLRLK
jgi:hypothetical protein